MNKKHPTVLAATTALVVLPVALVAVSVNVAHAESRDFHDGRGDVYYGTDTSAPIKRAIDNTDVTSSEVTYNNRSLRLVVQYRRLTATGLGINLEETIKRPHGVDLHALVDTTGNVTGDASLPGPHCKGVEATVNYHADVITMDIPTSCIGRQAWVKVKGASYAYEDSGDFGFFVDDLNDHSFEPHTFSGEIGRG